VHARLCNGAAASLPWKLLRTYLESCANIVQAVVSAHPPVPSSSRPSSCWPVARHVRLRNPIKYTLAHDAVAAVVLHKHHLIIRVGADLIQFVYGSHSRLTADLTLDKNIFSLPFSRGRCSFNFRFCHFHLPGSRKICISFGILEVEKYRPELHQVRDSNMPGTNDWMEAGIPKVCFRRKTLRFPEWLNGSGLTTGTLLTNLWEAHPGKKNQQKLKNNIQHLLMERRESGWWIRCIEKVQPLAFSLLYLEWYFCNLESQSMI